MFGLIKNWFKNEEKEQEIKNLREQVEKLQNSLETIKQEKDEPKENETDDPLVQIRGEKIDANQGILLDLEWNDDFIRYLKENGIGGNTDEECVKNWLVRLYGHLASRLEEEEMKKQEEAKSSISDFT